MARMRQLRAALLLRLHHRLPAAVALVGLGATFAFFAIQEGNLNLPTFVAWVIFGLGVLAIAVGLLAFVLPGPVEQRGPLEHLSEEGLATKARTLGTRALQGMAAVNDAAAIPSTTP